MPESSAIAGPVEMGRWSHAGAPCEGRDPSASGAAAKSRGRRSEFAHEDRLPSTSERMRAIFISYRRDDAEGQAGRLFADLSEHFGDGSVFMDVAGIQAGRDFRRAIDEQVASCGVLLALIGRDWVDAADEAGRRRLDDPMDFVRLETASALKRDIPVVPVLVHGARMPRADQLPADLQELAYRNAVELTHPRWESDVQVLIKALAPHVGPREDAGARATAPAVTRRLVVPVVAAVAVAAVAGLFAARALVTRSAAVATPEPTPATMPETTPATTLARPEVRPALSAPPATPAPTVTPVPAPASTPAPRTCAQGYVHRRAFPQDDVCVLHASAARAAADNRKAESRRQPGDARACRKDFVFREASQQDDVCVPPATRTLTALENRQVSPRWRIGNFPPPNAGEVAFTIMPDGNPACASYDGGGCLWGTALDDIEFERLNPVVCGEGHAARWGATGYENPEHWCSLAQKAARAGE
jgi:TIR domain